MSRKAINDIQAVFGWFEKHAWNPSFDYKYLSKDQKIVLEQEIRQVGDVILAEKDRLKSDSKDKVITLTGGGASLGGLAVLAMDLAASAGAFLTICGGGTTATQLYRSWSKKTDIKQLENYEEELREFSKKIDGAMLLND